LFVLSLWGFFLKLCPYFLFFPLSILSTLPPSSSHPYSHNLHSLTFSCTKIHCSPSKLLFWLLLIHTLPLPNLLLPFSPNLSPDCPTLLHTHHLLKNLLHQLYTTLTPAIPDISTLHYNNRYTPKHTQEPQNPAAPMPHSPSTHSFSHPPPFSAIFNNFPNSISNLLTITPLNFHCL
jgi:hypothetical protein